MGGLQITVITELLDREGKVIPKLYAAGKSSAVSTARPA
jgi:predicted oxidoreductase